MLLRQTWLSVFCFPVFITTAAYGQQVPAGPLNWSFRTSLFMSGNSDPSDPAGYKVYSAIGLVAALDRRVGRFLAVELSARTESREMDVAQAVGPDLRLGSVEFLPLSALVQFRPRLGGGIHPYLGAGVNLTVSWEESGALDSMAESPSVGPALQLGSDFDLSSRVVFNLDCKWNTHRTDLSSDGVRVASLKIDPLLLSAGVGFRF